MENIKSENTSKYPCPNCGGNMVFNPDTQTLYCPFCQSNKEIQNSDKKIEEYDFDTAINTTSRFFGDEKRVIKCSNCGGEIILNAEETAKSCPFCGSSYVVSSEKLGEVILPESLIPFKISDKKAKECFSYWIKHRFWAPSAIKNEHHLEKITGVYIPSWTYDCDTNSSYTAEAGEYYWVTVTDYVDGKKTERQERRIRWHFTSGRNSQFFDDVIVNASRQIPENKMQTLEPYYLKNLIPYEPSYLSGFLAERYSIGLKDGWYIAKEIVDEKIHEEIKRIINADEVRNLNVNTSYNDIKFKHILLPIWISSYTYKQKIYRFLVNGETGKVDGEAPISALKVTIAVLIIIAFIILFMYISQN